MKAHYLRSFIACLGVFLGGTVVAAGLFPLTAAAQETGAMRGVVLDIEGQPVTGTTVFIEGTTTGTVTGVDGSYTLPVDSTGRKIVFSCLGYQTVELIYNGQQVHNVVMRQASTDLDDIVVVGYGSQRKESVTGALSTIFPGKLERSASISLSNAIGGSLPGIISRQSSGEPGNDYASLFIRGMATWQDKAPLIMVDGVERDMNLLNVAEIESFTILKDASATAVYGVRGANGVILINTKRGKMGKPKVTFRTESAMLRGLRFPKYIDGYEFASLMNEATYNATASEVNLPWSAAELELFRNGTSPYLYPSVDWTDDILKRGAFQTINNLSITGGTEIIRYFLNVGYTSQTGLFKEDPQYKYRTNSRSDRYNFRSNIDVNVAKNFTLSLGLGGIIQDKTYPGTSSDDIFAAMRAVSPIQMPRRNPDGSPGSGPSEVYPNPWAMATQSGYSKHFTNTLQGTFGANWDLSSLITEGLSVTGKFSYDFYYDNAVMRNIVYGMYRYLGQDEAGNDIYNEVRPAGSMDYEPHTNSNRAYYYDVGLNYNRSFGSHHVGGMFIFNRRDFKHLTASSSMFNLPFRRQGIAGRATYDYRHKYLAEFNFRYNGSENFKKGSRYGFFPSVSAGWVVSEENFWRGFLSDIYLKLRGSYGIVGNDQISDDRFLYLSMVDTNANGALFGESQNGIPGYSEYKMEADVTWEKSYKFNGGFELRLFKERLSLQTDFFIEDRKDILLQRGVIPDIAGISAATYANLGRVKNKGIDAMIEFRDHRPSGFYYSVYANFTYAFNRIIEDDSPLPKYWYQDTRGRRIGQHFGYLDMGFFESWEEIENAPKQTFMTNVRPGDIRYVDVNGDGVIDSYDMVPIGYAREPEMMFGFGAAFTYKNFDLSFGFTGAARATTFLDSEDMWPFSLEYPRYNVSREYYDNRWIPGAADNSTAKYPAVINANNSNNYQRSTIYMRDAKYLKLKNAEIGYTLPAKAARALSIEGIRVFINGTNLLCFDKLKIVDPEVTGGTGNYPQQRTFNIGAQINF